MVWRLFGFLVACFSVAIFLFGGFTFYLAYVSLASGPETIVFGTAVGSAAGLFPFAALFVFLGVASGLISSLILKER